MTTTTKAVNLAEFLKLNRAEGYRSSGAFVRATNGTDTDLAPIYLHSSGRINFAHALYAFEDDDCHLCDLIEHRLNAGVESGEVYGIRWEVVYC